MKSNDPVPDRLARIQQSIDALMEALHRQKAALDTIRDDLASYRTEAVRNDEGATPPGCEPTRPERANP
jgi:hypothetical protein